MERDEIRSWILYGGLSLALTLLTLGLLLGPGLNWAVGKAVDRLPLETEEVLGGQLIDGLFEATASRDPAVLRALSACARVLPREGEARRFRVLLLEEKEANAFALPGGSLVLTRGLLERLRDESELFAVLGHEAGHVRRRHYLKRLARHAGIGVGLAVLLGDSRGLTAVLGEGGRELLQNGYGRREEERCDDDGLELLRRLELDPHGVLRLMERLQEAHGGGLELPELLSTHPATARRLERLRKAVTEAPGPARRRVLSQADWAALKKPAPGRAPRG